MSGGEVGVRLRLRHLSPSPRFSSLALLAERNGPLPLGEVEFAEGAPAQLVRLSLLERWFPNCDGGLADYERRVAAGSVATSCRAWPMISSERVPWRRLSSIA